MKRHVSKLLLLLILSVFTLSAYATVAEYSFASTLGTYTEITGGTIHGTAANDNECFLAIPIGFTFTYNGVAYNNISIATNGFIAMGDNVVTSNVALSAATGTNNVAAALNRDIKSRDNGSLMTLTSGAAPNRVMTIQWTHYRRFPTSTVNDDFSFQIQLLENGNKVQYVYGPFTTVTATTAAAIQVGLRGDSNADFNNRTTTTDWSATTAGTANNNSCTLSAAVFPANGLTFTFSPATAGEPPMPAQNPNPANSATNVAIGANLSWAAGGGTTDGYKVYLGTNNPPTNIVNGTTQTATTYDPAADFTYNTMYYWQIVPFNANGDAVGCPVWSFTTLADPTVTAYPYTQNFDTAVPPALPVGWTSINANNDVNVWGTYAGNAESAPNSIRIKYNDTLAMNDWLIAPPMVLTAPFSYKVKFYYRANSATLPEKLSLYYGTAPTATGMNNLLWENLNITNVTYEMAEVIVPITTTGTYYVGFHGHSDADMFYIYVDTFSVTELTEILDPPTNLTATVAGNNVHLAWVAPGTTPSQWIHYDSGENDDSIGTGSAADFDVAIRFPGSALTEFVGSSLYALKLWPAQAGTFSARVWTGGTPTAPGTRVVDQAFTPTLDVYNTVVLNTPVPITGTEELWFGYRCNVTSGYPAGCDAGPAIDGFGNMMYFQGAWSTLLDLAPSLNYNWNIQGWVGMAPPTNAPAITMPVIANNFASETREATYGSLSSRGVHKLQGSIARTDNQNNYNTVDSNRTLLGYKVYRDGTLLNTIQGGTVVSYDDNGLAVGDYSYTVTAYYDGGESVPAGPVAVSIVNLAPPLNLTAEVTGNDVTLNWESPEAPPQGTWITWANDVLGNSVGTGGAATFEVAHRWAVADLTQYVGSTISQMKFVPAEANCTYTVKVWTGGSATNAGTLVSSQVISNPVIDNWNLIVLNTPVVIPANQEVWVGFACNTQTGYPAGCDNGPQIDGKGNMMYINGAWSELDAVAPSLTYNWLIQTFVETGAAKAVELMPIADNAVEYHHLDTAAISVMHKDITRTERALAGFKVYRDGVLISTINDPLTTTYSENDLPNATYLYGVSAVYTNGESVPATVSVVVDVQLAPAFFTDDFEGYPDFALTFAPWTMMDQDASSTYGIQNVTFPNSESPMAYIIFNPSATTPPITGVTPHSGARMAASFAATQPPNNDYMVSPRVHLGTNSSVKFYARSHTSTYGLERFRVAVSLNPNVIPQGWQYVSGPEYVEAPTAWTEYVYDLSAYDNQNVYIAIRCVSNDAFVFYVDDFSIHSVGGSEGEDQLAPVAFTELKGNYPNPFNPETTISYSVKENLPVNIEIYNLKGQKVKSLVKETKAAGNYKVAWNGTDDNNRPVSSGVYFFKMNAGKYSSTKKMIMMK